MVKLYLSILEVEKKGINEDFEYLEVAEITVRRWGKSKKIKVRRVGSNIVFNVDDLKKFKKKNKALKP